MKEKITDFDPAAYLDSEETIAEYLTVILEENDPDLLLAALSNVAKALSCRHGSDFHITLKFFEEIFECPPLLVPFEHPDRRHRRPHIRCH